MNRCRSRSFRSRRPAWAAALALALVASPALAEDPAGPAPGEGGGGGGGGGGNVLTERLLMTPLAGWKKGGATSSRSVVVTHLLPAGQSTEDWTEMVTIQVIADARTDARTVVNRVAEASRSGCDVAGPSPISEGVLNNYPVATMTVTCNRGHQSGKGGLVAVKAIRGRQALFVVERLWRGAPFGPSDPVPVPTEVLQDWALFLRGVSVCDEADPRHHPCP